MSGQRDEFAVLPSTLSQAEALTSLGDKPLVVVSATVDTQEGWPEAQKTMVSLSSNTDHRPRVGQDHGLADRGARRSRHIREGDRRCGSPLCGQAGRSRSNRSTFTHAVWGTRARMLDRRARTA
jgi:hypothetical protein